MSDSLRVNTLFLALIRPSMFCGVTFEYFMVNIMASLCLFLLAGKLSYMLVGLPVHVFGVLAHKVDTQFMRLLSCRSGFPKGRHYTIWGVQSYAPY